MMEKYKVVRVLNSGSFGTAILVTEKSTGALHVIKDIDISKLSKKERETTLQEVRILEALRHPNIVAFEEAFTQDGSLKIVMQFCDGGDLLGLVKSQAGKLLDENYVLDIFVQLALAIKHVHDRKIIHRDIKTENIFLSAQKRVVKLGDFGIAKVLENTLQQARTSIGTPYYLSPEICQGKLYNFKSDIWSLGVVLYELCALRCPFAGANMKGLMLSISKGSYAPIPASFSSEVRKLIADMLSLNPKLRPSINDLLRRPVLQQRISKLIEGSVFRQEFSHTVLHGQHYSKAKCPNPAASPALVDVSEQSPASANEVEKQKAVALHKYNRVVGCQAECVKAQMKAGQEVRCEVLIKPQAFQVNAVGRDNLVGDLASAKLEREKRDKEIARALAEKKQNEEQMERERRDRAAIAEKAERDKRDRELAKVIAAKREYEAKIERDKREKELARHRELHQIRIEKQAEAAIAAAGLIDRAEEDRVKQKKQQILALEDFRQRQAKQWLGGAAQAACASPSPAERCGARKEIASPAPLEEVDVAVAKRLWSAKSPALNSVDQVKARGAAQKIEEQQKYEKALAIARKQAYLERLAAEDRRQRELHSALQDKQLMAIQAPAADIPNIAAIDFSNVGPSPKIEISQPVAATPLNEVCVQPGMVSAEIGGDPKSGAVISIESARSNQALQNDERHQDNSCKFEADEQEEHTLREIVGELMHLTLDPSSSNNEDDDQDDEEDSSVFEKIESLRILLENHLGTQNFLQLYALARACQDGSSEKLEAQIDSICSQDSDQIFNELVQLLNFESEVYS